MVSVYTQTVESNRVLGIAQEQDVVFTICLLNIHFQGNEEKLYCVKCKMCCYSWSRKLRDSSGKPQKPLYSTPENYS